MYYPITPIPKPRMTHQGRYKKSVQKFYSFRDDVNKLRIKLPHAGAHIIFHLPIPKSREDLKSGDPHQQTPDLDNIYKAIADSVYSQDCVIWNV